MGIDYYTCDNFECGENFPDCGDYFPCDCGHHFCSIDCGGGISTDSDEGETEYTCIICRGESITNWDLLQFLLKKYSITRQDATDLYKKEILDI